MKILNVLQLFLSGKLILLRGGLGYYLDFPNYRPSYDYRWVKKMYCAN